MGKITENAKYLIKLTLETEALVERPDIIGAIFGQTEGLLGLDMDLKELQEVGRIGRIDIIFKDNKEDKTKAEIIIPSNLSASETALIAAALETVDKVGHTKAKITLKDIEDIRNSKRSFIERRSKEILNEFYSKIPDTRETLNKVEKGLKQKEIRYYNGLVGGPEVGKSKEIILVEGRADVINLVRCGIKNAIEVGGSKISPYIKNLIKDKIITVFLDGDRGGDLILKSLKGLIKIDFVIKAPNGKEVEELTKKEIYQCLKHKKPEKLLTKKELPVDFKKKIEPIIKEMLGTKEVKFLDSNLEEVHNSSCDDLPNLLTTADLDNVVVLAMDGKLTKDLADKIEKKGIKAVVCFDKERFKTKMKVLSIHDF
ncbi:MAG TPA: DNA primase [Candidatus Aenigmarchaeota archaeon]|nr:DNA primase [Candidatus Aenigmarchaeota archaeon]